MFLHRFDTGRWLFAFALVVCAHSAVAQTAFDLSDADEQWLEQSVGPLITIEEANLFREVRPADRELFKDIFWLRRDPDLTTPENEFRRQVETQRAQADARYQMRGRAGSTTEIGRVMILMGRPNSTDRESAASVAEGTGARTRQGGSVQGDNPVSGRGVGTQVAAQRSRDNQGRATDLTWVYDANTELRLKESLSLEFRMRPPLGWVLATPDTEEIFAGVREARVLNPSIDYLVDTEGALERPAELDAFSLTPTQIILRDLRATNEVTSDFAFKPSVSFFHAEDGSVYSPLLLEVSPEGWSWRDGGAEALVFGLLETNDGAIVADFEQSVSLDEEHAVISVPLQAEPGVYQLLLGIQDPAADRLSTKIISLPLPGVMADQLSVSTVLVLSSFEQSPGEPSIGNAYQFGDLRMTPHPTRQYGRGDTFTAFYYVYGYSRNESGEGNVTAQYRFYRNQEPYKQYRPKALPAQGYQSGDMIEIPLADFEPGEYQIEIIIRDEAGDATASKVMAFTLS